MSDVQHTASTGDSAVPLCVQLAGGLLPNSPAVERFFHVVKHQPRILLRVPVWIVAGRDRAEEELTQRAELDVPTLPFDEHLLLQIGRARAEDRRVFLVSDGHERDARVIADHLGVFDDVLVSSSGDSTTIEGKLANRFGRGGFDVVGRAWPREPARSVARRWSRPEGSRGRTRWKTLSRALRVHQWLKNMLIFLPVLGAQRFGEGVILAQAVLAFVAFSLTASAVYVVNDLVDLREDRQHPTKRERPFASGALPIATASWILAALITGALVISAFLLPPAFSAVLAAYLVLTFAYSLRLKGAVLIDVITLAGLYTLRIIAGAAATGITPSVWLLGFSLFFFLSLGMVKRYAELHDSISEGRSLDEGRLPGRGYQPRDLPVLIGLGAGTGCVAVLVLALYVISEEFTSHYRHPVLLWLLCPLLLYWIARAWIVVGRNEMTDDPLVWAVKDQLSRWVGVIAVALLILAR